MQTILNLGLEMEWQQAYQQERTKALRPSPVNAFQSVIQVFQQNRIFAISGIAAGGAYTKTRHWEMQRRPGGQN
jgi:hypothetical protein